MSSCLVKGILMEIRDPRCYARYHIIMDPLKNDVLVLWLNHEVDWLFGRHKILPCVRARVSLCGVRMLTWVNMFLTLSQTSPGFYVSAVQVFGEKTAGKGEIARYEQFLLFPQCFLPVWRTFFHFHQIWNYRLKTLSVWKSLKFVVWERGSQIH